jgi:hypothetical protein
MADPIGTTTPSGFRQWQHGQKNIATELNETLQEIDNAIQAVSGASGIAEAPQDGAIYGRQDAAWEEVLPSGSVGNLITEAPQDGSIYGRKDAAWEELATEYAASDISNDSSVEGVTVKLALETLDTGLQAISGSSGFPEAPEDGTLYGRKDAAWEAITASSVLPVNAATENSNFVLQASHANTWVINVGATTTEITVPNDSTYNFPVDTEIFVYNVENTNIKAVAAAGVTLEGVHYYLKKYGRVRFKKRAANTWICEYLGNIFLIPPVLPSYEFSASDVDANPAMVTLTDGNVVLAFIEDSAPTTIKVHHITIIDGEISSVAAPILITNTSERRDLDIIQLVDGNCVISSKGWDPATNVYLYYISVAGTVLVESSRLTVGSGVSLFAPKIESLSDGGFILGYTDSNTNKSIKVRYVGVAGTVMTAGAEVVVHSSVTTVSTSNVTSIVRLSNGDCLISFHWDDAVSIKDIQGVAYLLVSGSVITLSTKLELDSSLAHRATDFVRLPDDSAVMIYERSYGGARKAFVRRITWASGSPPVLGYGDEVVVYADVLSNGCRLTVLDNGDMIAGYQDWDTLLPTYYHSIAHYINVNGATMTPDVSFDHSEAESKPLELSYLPGGAAILAYLNMPGATPDSATVTTLKLK